MSKDYISTVSRMYEEKKFSVIWENEKFKVVKFPINPFDVLNGGDHAANFYLISKEHDTIEAGFSEVETLTRCIEHYEQEKNKASAEAQVPSIALN